MPLYEYQCDACAHRFERIQKFSDPLVDVCPSCGGHVRKLLSSPAFQFKGSGFYITDYPKKSASESGKGDGAQGGEKSSESSSSKSDGGAATATKAETKADSTSESKAESKSDSKPKAESK
jgi:putative FmdB family regulatory protein